MSSKNSDIYPVLLAGGSGTRLWPVSRELYPKQLVNFIDEDSLVQGTIKRLSPVLDKDRVRIVCGQEHYHETAKHLFDIGLKPEGKIITEPCGRNTAPAILLAVLSILEEAPDTVIFIFPADHVIRDVEQFHENINRAATLAHGGSIVTFGIQPGYPETGYGYIEGEGSRPLGALAIKRFVEKPDLETAKAYIRAGNFFWNSGMFAFKGSVILEEFKKLAPEIVEAMAAAAKGGRPISAEGYRRVPNISFDYAIMERTTKGVVLPSDFGWSDIGSWKSLYDFLPQDADHNVLDGDVIAQHTTNSFILGHDRLIATNHLDRMVVVETPDSVFVSDLENSRDVKDIVNMLKHKGRREYQKHNTERHVWGSSTILEDRNDLKVVKRLVAPGAVYQETFEDKMLLNVLLVRGKGTLLLDDRRIDLKSGGSESIMNPGSVTLENTWARPLLAIETRAFNTTDR